MSTSSILEIAVDLFTISSLLLKTHTFYTVFLDVGNKQTQLSQKKCASSPGVIDLNQTVTIRITTEALQQSSRQAQLTIYSIHNYGRKKLFGRVSFIVSLPSTTQLKMKLLECQDSTAFIQFRCRTSKIQSRILSLSNSRRTSSKTQNISQDLEDLPQISIVQKKRYFLGKGLPNQSILDKDNISASNSKISLGQDSPLSSKKNGSNSISRKRLDQQLSAKMSVDFSPKIYSNKKWQAPSLQLNVAQPEQDLRTTIFQLPYRALGIKENDATISISKNLEMMENYSSLLDQQKTPLKEALPGINSTIGNKQVISKDQMGAQLLKLTQDLNHIHQQEDILNNDEKILEIIEKTQKQGYKNKYSSIHTLKDYGLTEEFMQAEQKRLHIENHIHDFIYIDTKHTPILRVQQKGDKDNLIYKKRSLRIMEQVKDNQIDGSSRKGQVESLRQLNKSKSKKKIKSGGVALIKPNNKFQSTESLEEWENDDNLKNIVHCMIDDVKGNLGYIKLSKLTHLRNQIKQIKDRNKHLIHANQCLIQTENFLSKKLEMAQQIIKQKQKILAVDFQKLREKFKEVTSKLVNKYSEQIERQRKIVQLKNELKRYEAQVKILQQQLEMKDKQVQHYKYLLVADDINKIDQKDQQISIDIDLQSSKEKQQNIYGNAYKSQFFKRKTSNSTEKTKNYQEINFPKESDNILKGINPSFKQFFLSFVNNKNQEPSCKMIQPSSRRQLKRGLAQMAEPLKQISLKQPQIQIKNESGLQNSGMFLQI